MSHRQERDMHAERLNAIKAQHAEPENESAGDRERRLGDLRLAVAKYAGPHGVSMAEANEYAGGLGLQDVGPPPAETEEGKRRQAVAAQLRKLKTEHSRNPASLRTAVALMVPRFNMSIPDAEDLVPELFEEEREQAVAEERAREAGRQAKAERERKIAAALAAPEPTEAADQRQPAPRKKPRRAT
jgi:hypothetical protein